MNLTQVKGLSSSFLRLLAETAGEKLSLQLLIKLKYKGSKH